MIAARLRDLYGTEARSLGREWRCPELGWRVMVEEDAVVRPALVGLARRMEEARPEAGDGRHLCARRVLP